jgi:hypothetical protein
MDPTCPPYLEKSESVLFLEAEQAARTHVLNGATMVLSAMSTFRKLGPAAAGDLQNLAAIACSTGIIDRGVCLCISRQYALVTCVMLLFVVVALFYVTTSVVWQKVLGRTFVMVQLCHSNDFGSIKLCSLLAIRILALLFAFQLVICFPMFKTI